MDIILIKPKNKSSIPFLKELLKKLSDVTSIEVISEKDNRVIEMLKDGLKETKDIIDGKKKPTTLKQLLDED